MDTTLDHGLVRFLGKPSLETNTGVQDLPRERPTWLLAYLCTREDWVSREELLELLWSNLDEGAARNNLRNLLHRVRQLPWVSKLETDAHGLRWLASTDVQQFRHAFTRGDWAEAIALYRGRFLEDVRVYDLPEFEQWLETERDHLQVTWRDAALNHAAELERAGAFGNAASLLEQVLSLDPYAEEVLQLYLQNLVFAGHSDQAVKIFEDFARRLQRELGLAPEESTRHLLESLLTQSPRASGLKARSLTGRHNLPTRSTAFIGRDEELNLMAEHLNDASCQLISLVGAGGAGKTRLALQAADAQLGRFEAGVFFVPLAAIESSLLIPSAIAQAFELQLAGASEPKAQILEWLAEKSMLLILDNFEHLTDGVELILELLTKAPELKILVTSRERLELPGERVLRLEGLPYPNVFDLEAARRSGAVRLFVERAAKLRLGFSLTPALAPGVLRICQLTAGMPLGIELAATWAGELSPEGIAAGIEDCLDFLDSANPELPTRHRSLRAVFEHSWNLISSEQQDALKKLSIFRGGFERRAALEVTGANPRVLLGLIGKSLLKNLPSGRFEMLEVLRQCAFEKLEVENIPKLQHKHAHFMLGLAQSLEPQLKSNQQARHLERLNLELDNQRAAFVYALEQEPDLGLRLGAALAGFWMVRGHQREGLQTMQALLEKPHRLSLPELAQVWFCTGCQAHALGRVKEAREWLEKSIQAARSLNAKALEADALYWLGGVERLEGNYQAASTDFELVLELQRQLEDHWGLASTLNDLGIMHCIQGQDAKAQPLFLESLAQKRKLGDRKGEAYALSNLALVTTDTDAARALFAQSLEIKRELGDQSGMATTLANLAGFDLDARRLDAARPLLIEATELFTQLGQKTRLTDMLHFFIQLSGLEQDHERALCLLAATRNAYQSLGTQPQPDQEQAFENYRTTALQNLGKALANRALEVGGKMNLEQAVGYALEGLKTQKIPS